MREKLVPPAESGRGRVDGGGIIGLDLEEEVDELRLAGAMAMAVAVAVASSSIRDTDVILCSMRSAHGVLAEGDWYVILGFLRIVDIVVVVVDVAIDAGDEAFVLVMSALTRLLPRSSIFRFYFDSLRMCIVYAG